LCQKEHPPLFDVGTSHAARCWLHHHDAPHRVERLYLGPAIV
jgi:hypothetical protein